MKTVYLQNQPQNTFCIFNNDLILVSIMIIFSAFYFFNLLLISILLLTQYKFKR